MNYFSNSYKEARERFITACVNAAVKIKSFPHPQKGLNDELLATDICFFGNKEAPTLILVTSGLHGVEGFCGSACQLGWITENRFRILPDNIQVLFIHAVNPFGFSWLSRTDENNIDLNRNFIDFDQLLPQNRVYAELNSHLVPKTWDEKSITEIYYTLELFAKHHSFKQLKADLYKGQYQYPNNIFYGGQERSWANKLLHCIFKEYINNIKNLVFIDLHSGLGDYGYGEPIFCNSFDPSSYTRAQIWYGNELTSWEKSNAASTNFDGKMMSGISFNFPAITMTNVTLEFGTYEYRRIFEALLADNWLRFTNYKEGSVWKNIKSEIRQVFNPLDTVWQEKIVKRFYDIFDKTLAGLTIIT